MEKVGTCRLCASQNTGIQIFQSEGEEHHLFQKITRCVPIQISPTDNLPNIVCTVCLSQLDSCYAFIERCLQADAYLRLTSSYPDALFVRKKVSDEEVTSDLLTQGSTEKQINTEVKSALNSNHNYISQDPSKDCDIPKETVNCVSKQQSRTADPVAVNSTGHIKMEPLDSAPETLSNCLSPGQFLSSVIGGDFASKSCNNPGQVQKLSKQNSQGSNGNHVVSSKVEKEEFVCQFCKKVFHKKASLESHERAHRAEKCHACHMCGKCFIRKYDLTVHYRAHTGERPYVCNICSKAFGQRCHLNTHVQIHTGEKPHVCTVCRKAFTDPSAFRRHYRRHNAAPLS